MGVQISSHVRTTNRPLNIKGRTYFECVCEQDIEDSIVTFGGYIDRTLENTT
jgi:hypothetical protein